jgi:hypothetical protein
MQEEQEDNGVIQARSVHCKKNDNGDLRTRQLVEKRKRGKEGDPNAEPTADDQRTISYIFCPLLSHNLFTTLFGLGRVMTCFRSDCCYYVVRLLNIALLAV